MKPVGSIVEESPATDLDRNKRLKLSQDVSTSLGNLSDEIVIMILNFMFDLDFGDNQRIFTNHRTSLASCPLFMADSMSKKSENDHLNTVRKLEPLRLVNKAWRDIITVRYKYEPWELSLLPSNSGILPLVFSHSPTIKTLHIQPLTELDMHLYLFFLHVYDLRFMKSFLVDLPQSHKRWECRSSEEYKEAEKTGLDTNRRILKSSFGLSLQIFSKSWSLPISQSSFIKAVIKVLAYKAVSLSNLHIDISILECTSIFKLKSWNQLQSRITHLSLVNSMNCSSLHMKKLKIFEKVVQNMHNLHTLTVDYIGKKFYITSSTLKILRVRMFHYDDHSNVESSHMDKNCFRMDFRTDCENLEKIYASISLENFEPFLVNPGKVKDLTLNITRCDYEGTRHLKYPLLSRMINEMPTLNKLVLILSERDAVVSDSNFFFLVNEGKLDIHSTSIQSIDALEYTDDVFQRIACPNLTDLKLNVRRMQLPEILSNPQLTNLYLKYTSLSYIDSIYDNVVEIIQECLLLNTITIAVHNICSEKNPFEVLAVTKRRLETLEYRILKHRKCSVSEEILNSDTFCSVYNLRLHISVGKRF